ncbi:MAG: response regulator transcription factor [Bacteroidota bacterium]
MKGHNILLLEDDPGFGYILSEYLRLQEFEVNWVTSGEEAIQQLTNHLYELAILDIMLPGIDGFEFANLMKQQAPDLPFIFLSAKSLKVDKLKGFRIGAYDYLTKPIDEELLVAKIKALLRQNQKSAHHQDQYHIGQYLFIPSRFQLTFETETIKLTAREAELLSLLCAHRQQLMPRKKALQQIWGAQDEFSRKSMDVFVSRLRKYLSKDAAIRIENVHGKGFILYG